MAEFHFKEAGVEPHSDDDSGDVYLWLAYVISVVEGSPTSKDCKLLVRCTNDKQHSWRTRLAENDTFDMKYSVHIQKRPYRDVIEKKNCLAINLCLTSGGKFDNREV